MKKVLLTGVTGFIGRALLPVLLDEGLEVIALTRNEPRQYKDLAKGFVGDPATDFARDLAGNFVGDTACALGEKTSESKNGHLRLVQCSMENIQSLPDLIADRDINCCIHLAWAGSTGAQRADYKLQLLNIEWACDLIKVLASMGITRFVGIGTLAEFDAQAYIPADDARPNGVSIYASAKIALRYISKALCSEAGIDHIWCQMSNIYGPGNLTGNFVSMACGKLLNGERAAFTEGLQNFDFTYIDDAVQGLAAAALRGNPFKTYFIGSSKPRQLKQYIYMIRDAINPDAELFLGEIPFAGVSLPLETYDTSALFEDTGFKAQIDFDEGIRKTVAWLKDTQVF